VLAALGRVAGLHGMLGGADREVPSASASNPSRISTGPRSAADGKKVGQCGAFWTKVSHKYSLGIESVEAIDPDQNEARGCEKTVGGQGCRGRWADPAGIAMREVSPLRQKGLLLPVLAVNRDRLAIAGDVRFAPKSAGKADIL
jgi:hypothetical protein